VPDLDGRHDADPRLGVEGRRTIELEGELTGEEMLVEVGNRPADLVFANLAVCVVPKEPEVVVVDLRDGLLDVARLNIGFVRIVINEPDLAHKLPLILRETTWRNLPSSSTRGRKRRGGRQRRQLRRQRRRCGSENGRASRDNRLQVQSDRQLGGSCQIDGVARWAGLLAELFGPHGVCAVVQAEEGAELFAVAAGRAGHRTDSTIRGKGTEVKKIRLKCAQNPCEPDNKAETLGCTYKYYAQVLCGAQVLCNESLM